jgi:thioredoxin reductase
MFADESLVDRFARSVTFPPRTTRNTSRRLLVSHCSGPSIHDTIRRAIGQDGQLERLETENGLRVPVEAFFVVQGSTPETELATRLGVRLAESGYIVVDEEQKTSVDGSTRLDRKE